jgi:chemotaxis protein methyltransferase CheR
MIQDTTLTDAQYRKLSRIVYDTSGIVLNEKKYRLLVARLSKRMRITHITNASDYIDRLGRDEAEFAEFIDATTTNHTFFFRENRHCEYLLKTLKPSVPLKIWSAASSSGEEAYSIAIQLLENAFTFSIDASDISDSMLDQGRAAVYHKDKVKNVPKLMLHAYFQRGRKDWIDHVRVKPAVRQLISFRKFNLLSDSPSDSYDVIFCRNVMIYFDRPTRQRVIDSLCRSLKPGGLFFVGMSEGLHGLEHDLTSVMPSGYRKKG